MKQNTVQNQNKLKNQAQVSTPLSNYFGQLSPRLREKAAKQFFGASYAKVKQMLQGK